MFAVVSVPFMTCGAMWFTRFRGWLVGLLIFATALGDKANINFMSYEWYRGTDRGFEVNLVDLIALSLVTALLIRFPTRLKWWPFNSFWFFAYLGFGLISTYMAYDPLLAEFTLFKMAKLYMVYWCVVNVFQTGISPRNIWGGMCAVGILLTGLALYQKYISHIYRIPGPFDHSNTIPLYVNLLMPMLLIWGLCDKRMNSTWKAITVLSALGMVFTIVATYSRAGIVLCGLCLFGVLVLINFRLKSPRLSLISILIIVATVAGGIKASDKIIERFKNAPESSGAARKEFNVSAKMMAKDHFFGVGMNNFSLAVTYFPKYREHFVAMANEEEGGVAHHVYLLTAAEMGYAGLAVFGIFITRFFLMTGWYAWRSKSFAGLLLGGLFMGFGTLHLQGLLEWVLRQSPVSYLFVITSGIAVAFMEMIRKTNFAPLELAGRY